MLFTERSADLMAQMPTGRHCYLCTRSAGICGRFNYLVGDGLNKHDGPGGDICLHATPLSKSFVVLRGPDQQFIADPSKGKILAC